ncbi:hypothetical protein C2S51_019107 [Perilla frutescens var. frutescens]|nr:hypothetical protein C2S51_019107 [Perilla frutescens var. frutescens]
METLGTRFRIKSNTIMKLNLMGQWVLMGRRRLNPLSGSRAFSSVISECNGGVSMVQGASRGIGLEFVKQLLEKSNKGLVVATCRNPSKATGLLDLKNKFSDRLDVHQLDLTIDSTIEETAKSVKDKYGSLNLLVNASGILSVPNVLQPETTLNKVERASLLLAYEINAVGPTLVVKHMWPLLKAGGGTGTERNFAVVANISARVGSIGDNRLGGWHSYRSSKSGLNQLTKTVSVEFARKRDPIVCILLHPGTVDTDLSRPFQGNVPEGKLFTKEFSVQKLLGIINSVKASDNAPENLSGACKTKHQLRETCVERNRETNSDAASIRDLAQELVLNTWKFFTPALRHLQMTFLSSTVFANRASCCSMLPKALHPSRWHIQCKRLPARRRCRMVGRHCSYEQSSKPDRGQETRRMVEDLNNLQPPPDFNSTITNNCRNNPSLRYCNSTSLDLLQIFKSTIVASHLCKISGNPNCVESFPKIDLRSQPKIAPLYLSFTFFWKYCPLTILAIDLSNSSLKGNFPTDVFHCSQIQALDLRLNNLSGDVPLEKFSSLENLTFLNLSYNGFSECRISETRFFERFDSSSFVHSGILPDHGEFKIKAVMFFVVFPAFVVATVVWLGWFCFRRESGFEFKGWVLEEASGGFSKRNLVGKNGSRSSIYRGVLRDGSEVRIEVYLERILSRENRRRLIEESEALLQLHHTNIVRVLGWCDSPRFMAVVTQFIVGNNIQTWLKTSVPPWKQRVQVILGISAAIRYLHEKWPKVGYKLKARNVVVSENGEPIITRLKFDDHHRSTKKIFFAFGVLLLEIVTSRRWNEGGFVEWVKLHFPGNLENLIDSRMKKTAEMVSEAAEMVELGLVCTDLSSCRRELSWDKFCDLLLKISHAHKHVHRRQY